MAFAKVGNDGDEEAGPGLGYVDQFTPEGALLLRLDNGEWLNAPWGMVAAPRDFGLFSGTILAARLNAGIACARSPFGGAVILTADS